MVFFSVYEQAQNLVNYEREYKPMSHILSGAAAGSMAALITNPLDVCKTLLNTQEVCCNSGKSVDRGLIQAMLTVISCRGYSGFFRGVTPRVIFMMPGAAVSWSVYEFFKYTLGGNKFISGEQDGHDYSEPPPPTTPSSTRKASIISPVYANDSGPTHHVPVPTHGQ